MAGSGPFSPAAAPSTAPSGLRRPFAPLDGGTWRARLRLSVISVAVISLIWSAAAFAFVWRWEETLAQGKLDSSRHHGEVFESLERLGIRTAIDDFGTGYSSLSYLTSYPVSRLKIAQQLVAGVNSDDRSATVVRAAVRLAQELGIGCIAEGVETRAQADFLVSAGCEAAQGYFFGAPISAEEMTRRLREDVPSRRTPPKLTVVAG